MRTIGGSSSMAYVAEPSDPTGLDVAGYVLVGGRSSRFGSDKALHPVGGHPMAVVVASTLHQHVTEVTLVGDPSIYGKLGLPVIPDDMERAGPLGGIVTALKHSRSPWCLIAACDMPKVGSAPFAAMFRQAGSSRVDAVIPRTPDGRLQPLLALYAKRALKPLSLELENDRWRISEALRSIPWCELPVSETGPFTNINRVSELRVLQ